MGMTHSVLPLPSSSSLMHVFFFLTGTTTTEFYALSLHDALPIYAKPVSRGQRRRDARERAHPRDPSPRTAAARPSAGPGGGGRSEEHTSELQSPVHLVYRLLLEKKKTQRTHARRVEAGRLAVDP